MKTSARNHDFTSETDVSVSYICLHEVGFEDLAMDLGSCIPSQQVWCPGCIEHNYGNQEMDQYRTLKYLIRF